MDDADVLRITACPLCGEAGRPRAIGRADLNRCRRCSLVFAGRVAAPQAVYTDDYFTGHAEFGPDTTDPVTVAIGRAAAARRIELIEREVAGRTMLDVGCGSGEALDVARDRGWAVVGVEPIAAAGARARARGHEVREGRAEDAVAPHERFDAVVASHVLEHVLDPVGFLRRLASHVTDDGVVALEVPNWNHRFRRRSLEDWDQLCPLEHSMHFTPRTLRRALRAAGLRPRTTTVTVVADEPLVDRLGRGFAIVGLARPGRG